MEREHGRIVDVSTRTLGSVLDGDHAAGVTSLLVHDAGDFDEDGGTLSVNGATLAYASVDDDASTITLTDALPAAALDGDKVQCWSTLYATTVTEKTAMVQLDGDDDNPDPIEAWVPHFLADKISDGDRGGPGESVVLGYDEEDDEWQILDVRGLAGASGAGEKHCNTDIFTVQTAGDQAFGLSHTPSPGSLLVVWHPDGLGGIPLTSAEWTLNGSTLTISDLEGMYEASDKFSTLYDYRDGPATPSVPATETFLTLGDTVTINNNALLGSTVAVLVGPPPQWKDDSDATYADLVEQCHGPGQPIFGSGGSVDVTAGDLSGLDPANSKVVLRVRVAAQQAGLPLPNVSLRSSTDELTGGNNGECPTTPTWVDLPLTEVSAGDQADFFTSPTTFSASVWSGSNGMEQYNANIHWYIYEVKLLVQS